MVLDGYMLRIPLREGSYYVGWIILVTKAIFSAYSYIIFADVYDTKLMIAEAIEKQNINTSEDPVLADLISKITKQLDPFITILSLDVVVFTMEMLLSFFLLVGLSKKNWFLVKFFYIIYPMYIVANIIITGVRISLASPRKLNDDITNSIHDGMYILRAVVSAMTMLPFERFIRSVVFGFTCFEFYSVLVVRSCYIKRNEEYDVLNNPSRPHHPAPA